jgi:hypothetical protein
MNVELQSVTSSTIDAFGYDPTLNELYVQFKSGSIYTYQGVSESVYAGLCEAESFGKFLNANIKGTYDYLKS